MPCYTIWTAPINPVSVGPDYVSVVQAPGAAQVLALAVGMAVEKVLPPDTVVQDVIAPPPGLPPALARRLYRVRQTSTTRRLERTEREEQLQKLLDAGAIAAGDRLSAEEARRAEKDYEFQLRAAESKRDWAARRLPWPPLFVVMAQSILEEVRQVDPKARLTKPNFGDDGAGAAAIVSETLGDTRIVLNANQERFSLRVEGVVPDAIDDAMTSALARGFARLKVDARDLSIARLPTTPPTITTLVSVVEEAARSVVASAPPTYVPVPSIQVEI